MNKNLTGLFVLCLSFGVLGDSAFATAQAKHSVEEKQQALDEALRLIPEPEPGYLRDVTGSRAWSHPIRDLIGVQIDVRDQPTGGGRDERSLSYYFSCHDSDHGHHKGMHCHRANRPIPGR